MGSILVFLIVDGIVYILTVLILAPGLLNPPLAPGLFPHANLADPERQTGVEAMQGEGMSMEYGKISKKNWEALRATI